MKFNSLSSSKKQMGRSQNIKCGGVQKNTYHSVLAGDFLPYQNQIDAGGHTIPRGPHIGCRDDKDTEAIDKCIIFCCCAENYTLINSSTTPLNL